MEGTANAEPWPDLPVCTEALWQVAAGVSRGSVSPLHFKASFQADITPAGWCFAFIFFPPPIKSKPTEGKHCISSTHLLFLLLLSQPGTARVCPIIIIFFLVLGLHIGPYRPPPVIEWMASCLIIKQGRCSFGECVSA